MPFRTRLFLCAALLAAAGPLRAGAQEQYHVIEESGTFAQVQSGSSYSQSQPANTPPTPAPSTVDHLHGIVVSSLTGKPVSRVLVTTMGMGGLAVLTDTEGRFAFDLRRPIPSQNSSSPGTTAIFGAGTGTQTMTLQFNLRRPGYTTRMAAAVVPTYTPSTPEPDIVLKITPGATISGHLAVDTGAMPQFLNIQLRRRQIQDGTATYLPIGTAQPDANGDFRFADLQPGDYKLFTTAATGLAPRASPEPPESVRGILPAFYPQGDSLDSATPIHLGPGETFAADLSLRAATFYRVTVPVTAASPRGGVMGSLVPEGDGFNLAYSGRDEALSGFLPPGTYNLRVSAAEPRSRPGADGAGPMMFGNSGGQNRESDRETASVTLNVGAAPLRTPPVTFHPSVGIPIAVTRDFTETDNTQTSSASSSGNPRPPISISLTPLQDGAFQSTGALETSPTGDLLLRNVAEGTYHVRISPNGTGYVAAASSGGVDLFREPLVVGSDSNPPVIEVTLRNDAASLKVDLKDDSLPGDTPTQNSDNPLHSVTITAIPLDSPERSSINGFIIHGASGDISGFVALGASQLANMPPGRYLVLAVEREPGFANGFEYHNPKVLESLIPKGVVVTLAPNQKDEISVPVLPSPEPD